MKIQSFTDINKLVIHLSENTQIEKSKEVAPDFIINFGNKDQVLSIEISNADQHTNTKKICLEIV